MRQRATHIIDAFLDGFTAAGLFRRLTYPGAPRYAVDPRPVDEILDSTGLRAMLPPRTKDTGIIELNAYAKEAARHRA